MDAGSRHVTKGSDRGSAMPRYLTKSRFALAVECETKLFYTGKAEYADHKKDDPFLSALAEGGFQVGEMAKLYFPGGHEIETLEHEHALARTHKLLDQKKSVILYEAAIRYGNLLIRADILIKNGSILDLIEVKSKSFDGVGPVGMLKRDGTIKSNWVPYLYDVAFQKHVLAWPSRIWKSAPICCWRTRVPGPRQLGTRIDPQKGNSLKLNRPFERYFL